MVSPPCFLMDLSRSRENRPRWLVSRPFPGVHRLCRQNAALLRHSEVQVQPELHHAGRRHRAGANNTLYKHVTVNSASSEVFGWFTVSCVYRSCRRTKTSTRRSASPWLTGGPSVAARWSETTSLTASPPSSTFRPHPCLPPPGLRPLIRSQWALNPVPRRSHRAPRVMHGWLVLWCSRSEPSTHFSPSCRVGPSKSAGDTGSTVVTVAPSSQDTLITVDEQPLAPSPQPPPEKDPKRAKVNMLYIHINNNKRAEFLDDKTGRFLLSSCPTSSALFINTDALHTIHRPPGLFYW